MQLRTFTGLWTVEKRLYKIQDINLPYPVSLRQIGLGIVIFTPWALLMKLLHVHFGPPFGHILWLFPPAILTWWSNRPVAEGKKLGQYVTSQLRYFTGSRSYGALTPTEHQPRPTVVTGRAWRRT